MLEADDYFTVVPATREEEAIGIAAGAYVSGVRSAVYMQSSGVGNSINALASLCLPARIPIPMLINLRGEVGELRRTFDSLRISRLQRSQKFPKSSQIIQMPQNSPKSPPNPQKPQNRVFKALPRLIAPEVMELTKFFLMHVYFC